MKAKHVVSIVVAVIGLIGTIGGTYIGAKWGQSNFTINVNTSDGKDVKVNRDNVETMVSDNESLKEINADYEEKISQLESENEDLSQRLDNASGELNEAPSIEFQDIGLSIDGEEQSINESKSCAIINGINYYTNDFIDALINKDKSVTIKDGIMHIGKIIYEQENLSDQWEIDSENVSKGDKVVDSYGNNYTDTFVFCERENSIDIKLDKKYSIYKVIVYCL